MPRPKHVRVEANFRTEAQCSACAWSLAAARKDDQWMCQCKRKVCFLKHCVRRLPSPPRATRLRLLCARRWRCVAASRRAAWHASPPALTRLQWLWGSTIASPRCPICPAPPPSLTHRFVTWTSTRCWHSATSAGSCETSCRARHASSPSPWPAGGATRPSPRPLPLPPLCTQPTSTAPRRTPSCMCWAGTAAQARRCKGTWHARDRRRRTAGCAWGWRGGVFDRPSRLPRAHDRCGVYDPASGKWTPLPDMRVNRCRHGTAVVECVEPGGSENGVPSCTWPLPVSWVLVATPHVSAPVVRGAARHGWADRRAVRVLCRDPSSPLAPPLPPTHSVQDLRDRRPRLLCQPPCVVRGVQHGTWPVGAAAEHEVCAQQRVRVAHVQRSGTGGCRARRAGQPHVCGGVRPRR